jgi:hypothetical protein
MEKYNYYENVLEDVRNYYEEHRERYTGMDRDELSEQLHEDCFIADSVTGNASGSYTFSTWQAEENLCHNLDLLREACEEFGSSCKILDSPEDCDVTIRCYLLSSAISEFCDELEEQGVFDEEEED